MPSVRHIPVRSLVLVCLLVSCLCHVHAAEEVVLSTSDFPPYVMENGPDPGPLAAVIIAAFREAGMKTRIVFYPWVRGENEVRNGKLFATFPYRKNDERAKTYNFSDPLYRYTAKFFYNKRFNPQGMTYNRLEDLLPYRVGGEYGFWYEPWFKKVGLKVDWVTNIDQSIRMLQSGRIDVYPEEVNTAWYYIRKLFPDSVDQFASLASPLEEPGVVNQFHLMVSRNYPDSDRVLKKFNDGLAALRANGQYRQILQKYQIATEGQ